MGSARGGRGRSGENTTTGVEQHADGARVEAGGDQVREAVTVHICDRETPRVPDTEMLAT